MSPEEALWKGVRSGRSGDGPIAMVMPRDNMRLFALRFVFGYGDEEKNVSHHVSQR